MPWEKVQVVAFEQKKMASNETREEKVSAAFVVLAREADLFEVLPSMQQMEGTPRFSLRS
jgi:hypothetical protein